MTLDDIDVIVDAIAPVIVELTRKETAAAVAALPKPEDGKSVTIEDVQPIIVERLKTIQQSIAVDLSPLADRIDGAERRIEAIRQAPDDLDARIETAAKQAAADAISALPAPEPVDYARIYEQLSTDMADAIKQIPPSKDGEPGPAGKDAPPVDEDALVARVVERIPVPKDGEPGKDIAIEYVDQRIAEAVAVAVGEIEIPKPRDGIDGKDIDPELLRAMLKEHAEESAGRFASILLERLESACV